MVLIARWTYAFLLLHNLASIAAFAISVITREDSERSDLDKLDTILKILEEVSLILVTLSVPFSYIIGLMAQCCCGVSRENNMEMDKVDKIYTDVWTTPSARSTATAVTNTVPSSAPAASSSTTHSGNYQFSVSRV